MAIAHFHGLTPTDPFTRWRRVTLAHPAVPHSLVIAAFQGVQSYQSTLRDWKASDGRSLTGSIRIQGGHYKPPEEWQLAGIFTKTMKDLFEALLAVQNSTATPVSLIDQFEPAIYVTGSMNEPNWLSGYPITGELGYPEGFAAYNVWLNVDANYKTFLSSDRYLVQFSAQQNL
jgi:hypothetical protein